jgi:hypothetical protein
MALPFDIANFNLVNFANAYNDLFDSTPKDVQVQLKDSNGNIVTKTVANRGKFKQQLWDDVGGALGQFNKTFYVDADNGDDNNDGSSATPFQTIEKALKSILVKGTIVLNSDVHLTSAVMLPFVSILINLNGYSFYVNNDSKSQLYSISLSLGGFITLNNNGKLVLPSAQSDTTSINNHPNFIISGYGGSTSHGLMLAYSVEVVVNDTHYGLLEINNATGFFSADSNSKITDNTGSGITWADLISGIIKDSNGVPRNVLSNIIL